MATDQEVAAFMMQNLPAQGRLRQDSIARRIRAQFGDEFTYKNRNRNWAIKKEVLEEFRNLSGEDVVWEQRNRAWRRRRENDKPGRKQK